MKCDVAVVGGGPAGWTAAVHLAETGLSTVLIGPDPFARWPNNYGAWRDEVEDWIDTLEHVWPRVEVRLDADRFHVLERSYVRFDNHRLQSKLRERGARAGLEILSCSVHKALHSPEASTLTLDDEGTVTATLVVDATGHRPALIHTARGRPPGIQVAYGVQATLEGGVIDRDRMLLMDFSADHLPADDRDPPTFLYAMPLAGDDVFVEETSLVARPAVDLELCRRRLDLRLAARGWRLGPVKEIERCFIPMGGPEPAAQRVVAFGGAAAAVHPATGYMIANVLRAGPRLAKAVSSVRDQREPTRWSRAAWDATWPADRRRAWMLYRYGMEVLLSMGISSTAEFFDTFFKIDPDHWQGYHSGDIKSGQVASAMWAVFMKASPRLRWQLMSKGFYALMPAWAS